MVGRLVLIDFSTFRNRDGKSEILKEVSIIDITSRCSQHFIFSPPSQFTADWGTTHYDKWLSKYYHGLDFYSGFTSYDKLMPVLNYHADSAKFVFAPTLEKAKILEKLFKGRRLVFDLEAMGCPPVPRDGLFPQPLDDDSLVHDGVEDTVDYIGEEEEEDKDELGLPRPCLYHHLYAKGCACTLTSAGFLADWCASHLDLLDMTKSDVRVKTFGNWKLSSPSAMNLAESGFVRMRTTKDTVRCVYCSLDLHEWMPGDNAEEDHLYNSPLCKLLRYKLQMKRQAELDERKAARDTHRDGETTAQKEFYRRYGVCRDLTEKEMHSLCHA